MPSDLQKFLADPPSLNLLCSAVILLLGLAIYWFWHPAVLHQHPFVERAFELWILKWMLFVITWGLLTTNADPKFVLACDDLNSVIGIGCVIALWQGEAHDRHHANINLTFIFGLLFAWNFVMYPIVGPDLTWLFPSMVLSLLFMSALSYVVIARYGAPAGIFAVVTFAYLLLQLPTYEVIFSKTQVGVVTWLAAGKLLYGLSFYSLFLLPIAHIKKLEIPKPRIGSVKLGRLGEATVVAILGGLSTELVLWVGKQIWKMLSGHAVS